MNRDLEACVRSILDNQDVNALYLYGSYVNGYYRKDSDIDVVVSLSSTPVGKPQNFPPNISIHYIQPQALHLFETGRAYAHLRMIPIYNEEECNNISNEIKSELVRRELIRFKRNGVSDIGVLDPIRNFLLGYGIERPWRIKPIRRILSSKEAQQTLGEEYQKIFGLLMNRGMVEGNGERYRINPSFVFDEGVSGAKVNEGFRFKFTNSYAGWHYLINLPTIIDFTRKRV
ncbi:MAG: nucleotidyltransferase domain-containing protein [Nanoarchaeota archaeon]